MPTKLRSLLWLLGALSSFCARSQAIEVFGKGAVSQNYLAADKNTIQVTLSGGVGVKLLSFCRLELRYTNIASLQNKLDLSGVGTINSLKSETEIYGAGLDIDILSDKYAFQPFIYLGAGYITTSRSYYFTSLDNSIQGQYYTEPKSSGISANGGAGFRLRLAKALAFEVEAFAYAVDIQTPNPLINLYGTAGVRIFL